MRKPSLIALAAAAAVALAAPAAADAQSTVTFDAGLSPSSGATKRKPKSATVRLAVELPGSTRRTVGRVTFRLPTQLRLHGTGFPACPGTQVAAFGEASCPAGSRVGSMLVTGALGTTAAVPVAWTANVFVASATTLAIAFRGLTPAVIEARVTGSGRRLSLDLPEALRTPLAGFSAYTDGVSVSLGATRTTGSRKKRKTYRLLKLTGCPKDRRQRFAAEVAYAANEAGAAPASDVLAAASACRRR